MIMKLLSLLMMAFFLLSIVVQFNDPDSLMWVGLYGAILVATVLTLYRPSSRVFWQLLVLSLVYATGIVVLSGSFKDTSIAALIAVGMKDMTDEKVRELWGLVVCLVWAVVLLFVNGTRLAGTKMNHAGSAG